MQSKSSRSRFSSPSRPSPPCTVPPCSQFSGACQKVVYPQSLQGLKFFEEFHPLADGNPQLHRLVLVQEYHLCPKGLRRSISNEVDRALVEHIRLSIQQLERASMILSLSTGDSNVEFHCCCFVGTE